MRPRSAFLIGNLGSAPFDGRGCRKVAERFLTITEATKLAGGYVDPAAGRVTLVEFATDWLSCQTFDPSTREAVESRLRVYILPTLGSIELRQIRPSTVQAWLRGRQETCAPRYVRVMLANLSAILSAAVEDDLIPRNPCQIQRGEGPCGSADQGRPVDGRAGDRRGERSSRAMAGRSGGSGRVRAPAG